MTGQLLILYIVTFSQRLLFFSLCCEDIVGPFPVSASVPSFPHASHFCSYFSGHVQRGGEAARVGEGTGSVPNAGHCIPVPCEDNNDTKLSSLSLLPK